MLKEIITGTIIQKLRAKTPRIGRTLRNFGLFGGALAGSTLVIPDVPDGWMQLALIILFIVMALKGQELTPEDLDRVRQE